VTACVSMSDTKELKRTSTCMPWNSNDTEPKPTIVYASSVYTRLTINSTRPLTIAGSLKQNSESKNCHCQLSSESEWDIKVNKQT
jgi:hypothetical protein